MNLSRVTLGKKGESLAVAYLKKIGYSILAKNYKTKLGEIDIIGKDKKYICFIEVRSVTNSDYILPEFTINRKKQHQITKVALSYIKRYNLLNKNARFDVVLVKDNKIELIRNAFELTGAYIY